jgi:hypothetical protein
MNDSLIKAANRAIHDAELAYQFNTGSYTWSALSAVHLRSLLEEQPNWIDLYDDFASAPGQPEASPELAPWLPHLWAGFQD